MCVCVCVCVCGVDGAQLCRDILAALQDGRCESAPLIVLAGARGGEGKSLFLKALFSVYGLDHVFSCPDAGNFPLMELPGRKIAFLDEFRFNNGIVSYATQCQWFDGSTFSITRPQNMPGASGHYQYRGSAPIFVTTKLADIEKLEEWAADDPQTGVPKSAEASMILRRLKVYRFERRIPKPPPKLPFCGHCFANLVLNGCPPVAAGTVARSSGRGTWV